MKTKKPFRRRALVVAKATTVWTILGFAGLTPWPTDYDQTRAKDMELTPEHLALLQYAVKNYDYVCFGDTNHSYPEFNLFVNHPDMVQLAAQFGKNDCFVEAPEGLEAFLDHQGDRASFLSNTEKYLVTSLITSTSARQDISEAQWGALQDGREYHFVDQRFASEKNALTESWRSVAFNASLKLQYRIFGKNDYYSPTVLLTGLPLAIGGMPDALIDDSATVEEILSEENPENGGLILYGAAHFWGKITNNNMHTLLETAGKDVVVINLHRTSKERDKFYDAYGSDTVPDADIIIFAEDGEPSIHIYDPNITREMEKGLNQNSDIALSLSS